MTKRTLLFVVFMLALVTICGMDVVGDQGVTKVCDGAVKLFTDTYTQVNQMYGVTEVVVNATQALGQGGDTSAMIDAVAGVRTTVKDAKTQVTDQCESKETQSISNGSKAYFFLFAVNLILGILGYCMGWACPITCLTFTSFGLAALAWLLAGSFGGISAFLDDTCWQLQLWHTCESPLPTTKPATCTDGTLRLSKFLKCPDPTKFQDTYSSTYDQVTNLILNYTIAYPVSPVQFTAPGAATKPLTVNDFNEWEKNTEWRKQQYQAVTPTSMACNPANGQPDGRGYSSSCLKSKCPEIDLSKPSSDYCYQMSILTATDAMWGSAFVASCTYLTATAGKAVEDDGSCNNASDGFVYLTASHVIIAGMYLLIVCLTIWASKVWLAANRAEDNLDKTASDGTPYQDSDPSASGIDTPYPGEGKPADSEQVTVGMVGTEAKGAPHHGDHQPTEVGSLPDGKGTEGDARTCC